ncbi:hypothetical protein JYU34_018635 [Plutella xylostella]|uniref:Uncharacterized protein n=1 Tax=Plutella xylostella TaxID=51655 RepID=A0ABQ7PY21_PLUXY|nr:hypothetical protein JYU34_018635 [Plutella xylostella]
MLTVSGSTLETKIWYAYDAGAAASFGDALFQWKSRCWFRYRWNGFDALTFSLEFVWTPLEIPEGYQAQETLCFTVSPAHINKESP